MPEADRLRPLPLARHVNALVTAGLLTILAVPVGSTVAEYEGKVWPNLLTLATALAAFFLLSFGLRNGPTSDDPKVARRGVPAEAVVERAERSMMSKYRGDTLVAQVVLLDLRVEAEGEPPTRVRLRRWVDAARLRHLEPGTVLEAKVLPGRPQDPALGLRRSRRGTVAPLP